MSDIQELFAEYCRMRINGLESKAVLHTLRAYIEQMSKPEREQLARLVRGWEAGDVPTPGGKRATDSYEAVSAPPKAQPQASGVPVIRRLQAPPPSNRKGGELGELQGKFDTRTLVDPATRVADDHFSPDTVLQMQIRGTDEMFELRPQQFEHEIVIGRSTEESVMHPDVDLADLGARDLGVSRLHLALRYDGEHNALHVYDLGSSNGSYINNQRLNPHEVRFLRDGDAVRIGKMVLIVKFARNR